jgi:hypothetical protein
MAAQFLSAWPWDNRAIRPNEQHGFSAALPRLLMELSLSSIGVVAISYNEGDRLRPCLASLSAGLVTVA